MVGLGSFAARTDRRLADLEARQTYSLIGQLASRPILRFDGRVDLRQVELKVFSQNGEDSLLNVILRTIGDSPTYFVEFGVQDGSECNTRLLAEFLGWSGVYFEPDPESFARLRRRYPAGGRVVLRDVAVDPDNVNSLFDAVGVANRFGVLSIDVDGQDYWIWKALRSDLSGCPETRFRWPRCRTGVSRAWGRVGPT